MVTLEEKFGLKGSIPLQPYQKVLQNVQEWVQIYQPEQGATGNCGPKPGKVRHKPHLTQFLNGSDFVYVHMEAPDEINPQSVHLKKFAVETIDKKVVKFLKDELEKRGIDYRMMILPDHPTPIKLKTHVSDPVPYIMYDSTNETDKNANLTYC